jgi:lysophospholipase L1-like esterase
VLAGLTAVPAHAASSAHYVGLGDSYSSGLGSGGTSSGGDCDRSTNAYPVLYGASAAPATFTFAACAGATTSTVISSQLSALAASTTLVSITVGGNDVGFSSIIETCVLEGTAACTSAVENAESYARTTLPGLLDTTYADIRAAAPHARVVALDYPDFYDLGPSICVGLSRTDHVNIDAGINVLDGVIATAAAAEHVTFADVRTAFTGHEICDGNSSWLHALNYLDIDESYHPTQSGQADAYLPVFTQAAG